MKLWNSIRSHKSDPLREKCLPEADKSAPRAGEVPAGGRGRGVKAFTLSEVLITLTIIGIVAAMTIPTVISNTQGKEWNAAKQKARMSIGEAFKLISINGHIDENASSADMAEKVIPKYLKLVKNCSSAAECGFASSYKNPDGTSSNAIPSELGGFYTNYGSTEAESTAWKKTSTSAKLRAAYFLTVDGFSVAMYYNPRCAMNETTDLIARTYLDYPTITSFQGQWSYDTVCFNAIYDMNGTKGPNQIGKDAGFVGSFYNGMYARSAAALPVKNDTTAKNMNGNPPAAQKVCTDLGGDINLPTIDELTLIYLNNTLVGNSTSDNFWSRSPVPGYSSPAFRSVGFISGYRGWFISGNSYRVRCVRSDTPRK